MQSKVLIDTTGLSRDEWLAWRRKGIGGSDAAAVCGLNRWRSPMEVWLDKTGRSLPRETGQAAYWGTLLEPIVREEFSRRTGLPVQPVPALLQHSRHPFMLANIDGLVTESDIGESIVEIKTAGPYAESEWEAGLPDEYAIQTQHYLAVTGLTSAYIAVLIGGNKFSWRRIERNEPVIDSLVELEARFWRLVEKDEQPPLEGTKAATDLINCLYPLGKAKSQLVLPAEAEVYLCQYEAAKAEEEAAAQRKDAAANQLKAMLGDYEAGQLGARLVTWKTINSERLDTRELKAACPDTYRKYSRVSTYRKFEVK